MVAPNTVEMVAMRVREILQSLVPKLLEAAQIEGKTAAGAEQLLSAPAAHARLMTKLLTSRVAAKAMGNEVDALAYKQVADKVRIAINTGLSGIRRLTEVN
jgi:hypothetical protein